MTLRSRLTAGLLAIAIILVVPMLLAVRSMEQMHRTARELRDGEFAASLLLGRLREEMNDLRRQEIALLFVHDVGTRNAMARTVDRVSVLSDSLLRQYRLELSARDVQSSVLEITKWAPLEYNAALTERKAEADSISSKHLQPALARADTAIRVAEVDLRTRMGAHVASVATEIRGAEVAGVIALALALAVAAAIALILTRSVDRPIRELERGMSAVAGGNFKQRLGISSDRRDEFGRLAESFDEMTRQLTELDKLKAEFVSVASHELKTPINVVLGYSALLREGLYGDLNEKQTEIVSTLETQAKALARLVKQLLDVSRFEAGGSKLELRPIKLANFLGDLEKSFHVLAVQRGVRFMVEGQEDAETEVVWDLDRMNEVLGNLLSNAFKFTERGGEVVLSVTSLDGHVQMQVRDTGAGISSEQLPHIFDKFYQADNQASAAASGTGLGLAIAKQLVEAHQGTIDCESTPGVGTTFTLVLPARVTARRTSVPRLKTVGAA